MCTVSKKQDKDHSSQYVRFDKQAGIVLTIGFKTPFGYNRLQSLWSCIVGKMVLAALQHSSDPLPPPVLTTHLGWGKCVRRATILVWHLLRFFSALYS